MSIVMNLYYTGIHGNARRFAEEMQRSGTVDLIRAEEGNERYEYFLPVDDPEAILLIDMWRDQQSIDRHHSSPMMETILELRKKYDLTVQAERYITDTAGIPDTDAQFISKKEI